MSRRKPMAPNSNPEQRQAEGMMARAGEIARDNPVAAGGAVVMALTGCLIVANALSLQPGHHPAPFFVTRERSEPPVQDGWLEAPAQQVSTLVLDLQVSLRRIGLYEGPLDGLMGPATERAIREYERRQGRLETGEATESLLALITLRGEEVVTYAPPVPRPKPRPGPIETVQETSAGIVPPPSPLSDPRLARIQQLLSDLGYGPLSADGVIGENTASAIRRFELDRGLPLTGQPSAVVVERLELVSGQKVD